LKRKSVDAVKKGIQRESNLSSYVISFKRKKLSIKCQSLTYRFIVRPVYNPFNDAKKTKTHLKKIHSFPCLIMKNSTGSKKSIFSQNHFLFSHLLRKKNLLSLKFKTIYLIISNICYCVYNH
jgi:hypothetical protein